jgi:hypothetical protein
MTVLQRIAAELCVHRATLYHFICLLLVVCVDAPQPPASCMFM